MWGDVRVMAIDPGERRIGVAVSDPTGLLASPYAVLDRLPALDDTVAAVARLVEETAAVRVVVGLPRQLSGAEGPAARAARLDAAALADAVSVPVELWDERLTTVSAARGQQARGRKAKQGRTTIDAEAAAVLLQSWLDGPRAREVRGDG